ncbi:hypothetical protein JCM10207_000561 [Rhodosporidiobolus poonsookiae]
MAQQEGLRVQLHPLPLLSISDHYTRTAIQHSNRTHQVFGALLGTQVGRDVDILNSFEIVVQPSAEGGPLEVDHAYFVTRRDQFKQVFPTFDFLGWYSIGNAPSPADLALHKQFLEYNESPLFLQLAPSTSSSGGSGKDLPVAVYESVVEIVNNEPTPVFAAVAYEIETGEAERVAVDHVSKPMDSGDGGAQSSLLAALSTQRNALSMLHSRISVILSYLQSLQSGNARVDPETLRQIAALVASLPGDRGADAFRDEFMTEYNDVLLTTYLAALTKQLLSANELLDKQLLLVTSASGSGEGGRSSGRAGGGGGGGRRGKLASEALFG